MTAEEGLIQVDKWILQEVLRGVDKIGFSIDNKKMVVLLFKSDIGKMVGLTIRQETSIQHNLICLDEMFLEEGDWIDIGAPLQSTQAFPVTVKSLVFNKNKEYSLNRT